jgi:thioredoxin reductase
MPHKTIIIGAGPAGIAAAIQLKRADEDFLLFEKGIVGGLLNNANLVENYPGFPAGLSGQELVDHFKKHLTHLGIDAIPDEVTKVEHESELFSVTTENEAYKCMNLVVATGTEAKKLDDKLLDKDTSDKIYYNVYPLSKVRGKKIAIIGGGDAAFDFALGLAGNHVSILYRKPKSLSLLHKRACESGHIQLFPKTEVIKIERSADGWLVKTAKPQNGAHSADVVVAAIGRKPCINFLSSNIKHDFLEKRTIKGLYYPGDISSGLMRQVAIAVGDGLRAAMQIIREG